MLVRTDISLAQQIVQVGHACLEAGRQFDWPPEPCNLVVLGVVCQADLREALERAALSAIRAACFYEPDQALGLTAACTEPLNGPIRRIFRRFPLWRQRVVNAGARGPPTQCKTCQARIY